MLKVFPIRIVAEYDQYGPFYFYSMLPYSDHLQLAEDYVTVEVYLQQDID